MGYIYLTNIKNNMDKQEKIKELSNKIIELKKLGNTVDTKKTIQKLQQEMSKLLGK